MKPMLEKHLEYLRQLHLEVKEKHQLAFQIIDHKVKLSHDMTISPENIKVSD